MGFFYTWWGLEEYTVSRPGLVMHPAHRDAMDILHLRWRSGSFRVPGSVGRNGAGRSDISCRRRSTLGWVVAFQVLRRPAKYSRRCPLFAYPHRAIAGYCEIEDFCIFRNTRLEVGIRV